jgi:hypothetical protein
MTNKNTTNCPVCGAAIPEDAPGRLCPKCVLKGAETVANRSGSGARNATPASVGEIAPHFPDLEIIELLGAGGMGAVYTALPDELAFDAPGRHSLVLATLRENDQESPTMRLVLDAVVYE